MMNQPHISNPSPSNGATGINLTPVLSVQVNDSQGDTMDVYFWTNASTGSWHKIGENLSVTNSTVQCDNTSEMNQNSTLYWWSVNVTDSGSGNWTNQTFRFTTEAVTIFDPFASGWLYRKTITINHSQVATDLINFPVLISRSTDADLVVHAQTDGDDILFMNDTGVASRLNHEIEYYNSGTGELICWVNVTHVSSTQDTLIYMYYGNPSCSSQENPTGVWDSHYVMVQHMKDATSSTIVDSTSYGNDGSKGAVNEPIETTAKIDMGQDFDGSNDYVNCGTDSSLAPTMVTVEGWVNLASYDPTMDALVQAGSSDNYCYELIDYSGELRFYMRDSGGPWYASQTLPPLNEWHYWTGTYDGSTISVYLDGQKGTDASHSGINTDISHLYIGRGFDNYIDSVIDEVRISNIARNSSWITTSYNTMNNTDSFITLGTEEVATDEPIIVNVYPANGSIDMGVQPTCHIDANDRNGDTLTVYWYENSTGDWVLRQTNNSVPANSTVYWIFNEANAFNTTFWWSVNVTDGSYWTNRTYYFTTVFGAPILNNPLPVDGATGVVLFPVLSIQVNDSQGDSMNVYFRTNSSTGVWHTIGENLSVTNGTVYCDNTSEISQNSTKYWWSVNATDAGSGFWTNRTFSFTTESKMVFDPFAEGWLYRKAITINHSQVAVDLSNFPVLISNSSDTDLTAHAQTDGDDILFMNEPGVASKLHHEIEYYDTGTLVAWVNVTYVSSTQDTVLYMYYGNPSCSSQENISGVWDANYKGVWHLNETCAGTGGTHVDSTSNDNDGTTSGGVNTNTTGIIDGADQLDGSDDYVAVPHDTSLDIIGEVTASLWIRPESLPFGDDYPGMISRGSETNRQYWIWGIQNDNDIGGRIGDTFAAPGGAGVTMQENNWYHIVITGNPTGDIVMYYNGAEVSRVSYGTAPASETTSLYMGYMDTFDYFPGSIDEVRVSNIERNLNWINTSYRNQHSPTTFYSIGNEESTPSDTTPPEITNVTADPDPQLLGNYVNITCDVTDNVDVNEVWINITYPDSSYHNESMLGGSYYFNTTYPLLGTYYYFVWANSSFR